MLQNPSTKVDYQIKAARILIGSGVSHNLHQAIKILLRIAENQGDVLARIEAATILLENHSLVNQKLVESATQMLVRILEDQDYELAKRIEAATILLENHSLIDKRLVESTAQILLRIAENQGDVLANKIEVAIILLQNHSLIDKRFVESAAQIIVDAKIWMPSQEQRRGILLAAEVLLQNPSTKVDYQIKAAEILINSFIRDDLKQRAIEMLLLIADNKDYDQDKRIEAARTIVGAGVLIDGNSKNAAQIIMDRIRSQQPDGSIGKLDDDAREFYDTVDHFDSETNNPAKISYAVENTDYNGAADTGEFQDALSDPAELATTTTVRSDTGAKEAVITTSGPLLFQEPLEMQEIGGNRSEAAEVAEGGVTELDAGRVEAELEKRAGNSLAILIVGLITSEAWSLIDRVMEVCRNTDNAEMLLSLCDDGEGYEAVHTKLIELEVAEELAGEAAKEKLENSIPKFVELSQEDNDGFEEIESLGGEIGFSDAFARVAEWFQQFFNVSSEVMDREVQVSYLIVLGEMLVGSISGFYGFPRRGNPYPDPDGGGGGSSGSISGSNADDGSLFPDGVIGVGNDSYVVLDIDMTGRTIDNSTTHFASE